MGRNGLCLCRCKVTAELTLTGRTPCAAQCEKCNASITVAFRPCMLHHYSDVLGYLDLHNAAPADLVLQECELMVGCLSCSQESPLQVTNHVQRNASHLFCRPNISGPVWIFFLFFCFHQNLSYGQSKEFNCEQCHSKLSILAESTRFQYIPPRANKTGQSSCTFANKWIGNVLQSCYNKCHGWISEQCYLTYKSHETLSVFVHIMFASIKWFNFFRQDQVFRLLIIK